MKKLISVLAIVTIVIVSFCSCGSQQEENLKKKIDPADKLVLYIIKNGVEESDKYYVTFRDNLMSDYQTYFIVYDKVEEEISFEYYEADFYLEKPQSDTDDVKKIVKINYNSDEVWCYAKTDRGTIYQGSGKIDKKSFDKTSENQLSDMNLSGEYVQAVETMKQAFSSTSKTILMKVDLKLKETNAEISLKDLGYINY